MIEEIGYEKYLELLETMREKRLQITTKIRKARQTTDSIKYGSVRATYDKKVARMEKMIQDIDTKIEKLEALYNDLFGDENGD